MKKPAIFVLFSAVLLGLVGCGAQQKGPEVAAYGTSRSDADHGAQEKAPSGREFWTKMR